MRVARVGSDRQKNCHFTPFIGDRCFLLCELHTYIRGNTSIVPTDYQNNATCIARCLREGRYYGLASQRVGENSSLVVYRHQSGTFKVLGNKHSAPCCHFCPCAVGEAPPLTPPCRLPSMGSPPRCAVWTRSPSCTSTESSCRRRRPWTAFVSAMHHASCNTGELMVQEHLHGACQHHACEGFCAVKREGGGCEGIGATLWGKLHSRTARPMQPCNLVTATVVL